jgi:hypothetical protein
MEGLEGNKIKGLGEEGNPRGKKEDRRIKERENGCLEDVGRGLTRTGIGQEGLRKKRVEEWRDGGTREKKQGESHFFHLSPPPF